MKMHFNLIIVNFWNLDRRDIDRIFQSRIYHETFIKREEEKESNKRQEFIKNFIKDYKDSGGDPSDLYSELDTILQEMDSQNYKEEPIKK